MKRKLLVFFLLLFAWIKGIGQVTIPVDLSSSANASVNVSSGRNGNYCGGNNCVVFVVTINPGSDLLNITSGQLAHSDNYTINCGPQTPVGTPVCVSGLTSPIYVAFCKPGNNTITYTITASTAVKASNDITLRQGCTGSMSVTGLDASTVTWTSIYPGTAGAYNSYLSCPSGCTSTNVTAAVSASTPAYIDYKVSGNITGCASYRSDTVRVYTVSPMTVSVSPTNATICGGSSGNITLTATPSGGSPPYTYSWSTGQTTQSITVTSANTYTVSVSDNTTGCGPIPQSVTVTAAPVPTAPTASGTTICNGTTGIVTATAPGGTYTWYDASTGGNLLYTGASYTTPALTTTTTYYVQTIVSGCTSTRTPVTVTVNPIPAAPTASSTSTCSGSSATLTATAPGGTYDWYDAASGGTLLFTGSTFTTPALTANTTYYVQATVNGCAGPRTAVTVSIIPTPVAPTASGTSTCSGTAVTLSATAPGGNYDWYDSATGGTLLLSGATYTTPVLTTTTTYYVQTTVNGCISARTPVTVTVNAIPAAPTAADATICNGTTATLIATAPGGTYQWFNAASGGTLLFTGATYATPALTGSTTYYVQTTVNGCTSPRSAVNVTVNPITAAPTAAGAAICNGSAATLTATAPGGTYDWFAAASGGSSLFTGATYTTPTLTTTTTYYLQATVNGCTGPRTAVTVTVNPTPAAPTASGSAICSGNTATLTATAPGGTYDWYDSASGGSLLNTGASFTTPVLTATTTYYVQTTVNGCVSARTAVTVTVNPLPVAPTASGSTICQGSTTTLTATAPGGTYHWYDAATGGTLLFTGAAYTTPALPNTTTYYVDATSASGCTGPRTAVTVTVTPPVNPSFSYLSGTFCKTGGNQTPTIFAPSGTFSSAPGGLTIDPNTGVIDPATSTVGTYTITFVTNTSCIYSSSLSITITNAPDATFSYNGPYCQSQANPLPTFPPGASAGIFSSTTGLVFLNPSTGEIDMQGSTPGTYTVTNNIVAAGGCAAASATNTITIKATPTVTSAATASACNNTAQSYTITSNVNGTTYIWSRAAVVGISNIAVSAQTSNTITESLINTTSAPINVLYSILPSLNGCDGPIFTYTITVNPTTVVTSPVSSITCNSTAQNYTITSSVSGTTYTWGRAAVAGISNVAVSGQTANTISETLVNTTSAPINVDYAIVPLANGCTGPTFTYTLTVNPTPTVTSATSAAICNNTAQNYAITSNVSGTTYTWNRANVAGISNAAVSGQTSSTITETLVNTTSAPVNVVYSILPSANGCDGPAFTYTLTVNPTPIVTSAASAATCNNSAQNYSITSNVSGTTYTWDRAAVTGISNAAVSGQTSSTITESLINTTSAPVNVVYNIVPTANGCSGPAFTYTVTVNPTPIITSALSAPACSNITQNYTITSNVSGTTYTWSRAAVAGISNAAVSGQTSNIINEALTNTTNAPVAVAYHIAPQANGCTGPAFTYTVTVNPTPAVTSAANATICNNTAQNYSITGNVAGTTYTWGRAAVAGISNTAVSGQTSNTITESLVNTTSTPVNAIYSIVPSANGCDGPAFTYTVTVNPTPTVTSAANAATCNNSTQNYTITGSVSGATFTWSRATVAGISNAAVSSQTANSITESLVNTTSSPVNVLYSIVPSANGCSGPAFTYTVTVNPTPTVTSAATAATCNNTAQNYTITGSVSGTIYTWDRASVPGISNAAVSGQTSNTITETLVNTTVNPIDVTYSIIPEANGCSGPVFNYVVTVNPTPRVTSAANAITCNSIAQNYAITSNVSGTTYTWSRAAVAGISNAAVSGQTSNTITESLINTSNTPVNVAYNITPEANGCSGPLFTYTITVNPTPTVTSASGATICNNTAQNYAISSNVAGATYTWDRATVSGISNAAVSGQTSSTITESLINTTSAPVNVIYAITPSANGCSGPAFTYTVTVNPTPTVTSTANATTCDNTAQNYTMTGNVSGTTYTWSRAAVAGISNTAVSGQTSSTITESLVNTTSAPINVPYSILPSANGCDGPVFTYTVTVNPTPTVTSTASAAICNSTAQSYTITSNVSGATYTWGRAAVAGISNAAISGQTSNTIAESLTNTTSVPVNVVYFITPSANGCSGPAFTYAITINPTPVVTSASVAPICNNTAQNYAITSNVSGTTYTWSRAAVAGISNATVSGQTSNTITESLVNTTSAPINVIYAIVPSANGCSRPAFIYTVTVNPTPTVTSTASTTICNNTAQNYIITGNVSGATYTWSRAAVAGISNAAVSGQTSNTITESLVNTTSAAVNVAYVIVPTANGCSGSAFTYTITVNPTPIVTSATSITTCSNFALSYIITSNVSGTTYTWSRAAVTGISNAAVSGQTSNTITESLVNTTSAPINVAYSIVPTANGCNGPAFTYTATVNPTPAITSAATGTVCNNTAQNYTITSNVSGTAYTWSRAAVAGISNPMVFLQIGSTINESLNNTTSAPIIVTYHIIPTINGCPGTPLNYALTVNPTPVVTSVANATICNNTAQNYTMTSNVSGVTYTWSRAIVAGISNAAISSQTSANITESLNNTTSAPVTVIYQVIPSINGCPGTPFNYTLTVNPTPTITNNPLSQTVCSQSSSTVVTFTSNVTGTTFQWTATATPKISGFVTSGTGNIPQQILLNSDVVPGSVTYTVTPYYNGCSGTPASYTIAVNPKPATPSAGSNSPVCQNYSLSLSTPTIAGATYAWIGPNGFTSNAQNPVINNVSTAAAGLYSLLVTVNGCTSDVGSTNVTILSTPAAPVASSNGPLCAGSTLILNANNIAGATYIWTGPNGFTSTIQNPSIANITTAGAGTYSVTATVNGCTSPAGTTAVVVNAIPAAPTATSNSPVCEGSTINLSVTSKPGTTYTWTGPNNFFSNLTNPSIPGASQANAGIYSVTATVGTCTGAPTSVVVAVDATPINPVASSNSPVCTGNAITLTSSTFIGATYKWTGPNSFSSTLQNPVINGAVPASAGIYTVSITAPGCSVTASTTTRVIVNQTPIAPTASSNSPVCIGDNLNLTASTVVGAVYSWTGPNGFSSTLQNPVVSNMSASTAGAYSVTVTVNSCTSAAATTNVIVSKPELAFAGNDQVVCANNSKVTLAGSVIGDSNSGIWTTTGTGTFSPSNISLSGTYQPSAADIAAGSVTLTLSSTNNGGCSISSSSFKVTINPTPIVNAGGDKSMCTNDAAVTINGSITNAPGGKWTSTGTGTFAPSDVVLTTSYIPSVADKAKGSVKLTLSSTGNNCIAVTDVMTLTIIPSPTITMPDVKYVLEGETTVLDPAITGTNIQYLWTPPLYLSSTVIRTPTLRGVESQLYNLKVTGLGGCVTEKQIMINVLKPIIIPNTFTPNGDGINDLWHIKELSNYPGAMVTIFNRYGTKLYYSKGYPVPWDGTYNGKPLPVGTYYYIIERGIYGAPLSGYVVIVR
ncbi:PKD-like domain-containing protein [Mucilaginibacter sp. AW1-3]